MKATAVDKGFSDPDWLFEVKLDGYRLEAVVDGRSVRMWTRNKQDAGTYFPDLASAPPTWIRAQTAIVDGEVVALDEDGNPSFKLLQARAGPLPRAGAEQAAPDRLLRLRPALPRRSLTAGCAARAAQAPAAQRAARASGRSLRQPHRGRRRRLLEVVRQRGSRAWWPSCATACTSRAAARATGSRSRSGASRRSWSSATSRARRAAKDLGSLIVAVNEGRKLHYVGEVGSGFDQRSRTFWRQELDNLRVDDAAGGRTRRACKNAHWAEPRLRHPRRIQRNGRPRLPAPGRRTRASRSGATRAKSPAS